MLTLPDYATVMAHLAHFKGVEKQVLLAKLGVPDELWQQTNEHWLERIIGDDPQGAEPAAQRFSRAFAATRERLVTEQPRLDELRPIIEPAKVGQEFSPVDETVHCVPAIEDPVPFVASTDSTPPPPVDPASLPPAESGQTQGAAAFSAHGRPPTPFGEPVRTAKEEPTERLTLAQYASLRAELEVFAEREAEILARYQLSDDDKRQQLESSWSQRLSQDPALERQFEQMFASFRQWLRAHHKPGP